MKINVTINVTKRDIEQGEKFYSDRCPIALAAKRVFTRSLAGPSELRFTLVNEQGYSEWYLVPLPDQAKDFIIRFDRGEPVEPFSFTVGKV